MSRKSLKSPCFRVKSDKNNQSIFHHPDLTAVIEIIKDKFYFATVVPGKRNPRSSSSINFFETDGHLTYNNFYDDFGPLNIACLYRYCRAVGEMLGNARFEQVVHFTSSKPKLRANAVYLVASYSVLYLKKSPSQVFESMAVDAGLPLKPFQDASVGTSSYTIDLLDCLNGLSRAASLGFFNFEDFDVGEYDTYGKLKNGELNWIVPQKFLAFLGPSTEPGTMLHHPEKYLNYFMKHNVVAVIRLNNKSYESFRFTNAGILHFDMFFPDGSVPTRKILKEFLQVAESTRGALAVHCKAGLGRTGTLIAAFMMKHYMFSAREAIAWLRISRPGSVIGSQQTWLENEEASLWREGRRFRLKYHGDENLILHHKRGIYSVATKTRGSRAKVEERSNKRNLLGTGSGGESYMSAQERKKRDSSTTDKELQIRDDFTRDRAIITQGDKLIKIKMTREN